MSLSSPEEGALRFAIQDSLDRHVTGATADIAARLLRYLSLLRKWNTTYNLTAVRDADDMVRQHLADCLSVVGPLRRHTGGESCGVLDVGSGGGLPGIVIAITNPQLQVTCVDAVGKKAAFLRQAALELGLPNLTALHARVEAVPERAGFEVITCRAFSSLAQLASVSAERLTVDGVWMAMKAKPTVEELEAARAVADVFHVEQLTVPEVHAERCLVWMRPRHGGSLANDSL